MSNVMLNIDKFLEYLECELNRSQRTVESYRDDLKHFEKLLGTCLIPSLGKPLMLISSVTGWLR